MLLYLGEAADEGGTNFWLLLFYCTTTLESLN